MRTKILLATVLVILLSARIENFEATELVGSGKIMRWQASGFEMGLMLAGWERENFAFVMIGRVGGDGLVRGKIVQIAGKQIENYGPYSCGNEKTICYVRENSPKWQGWMWFRGHERRFCGGPELPKVCMLKGE